MPQPKVVVMSGYGLNCEEETLFAFQRAGAQGDIIHINDLIEHFRLLSGYQVLAIPGGFSYGDDTGSGNAFANKIRNHLWAELQQFVAQDHLVLGICNGFQVLVNLGLLPAWNGSYGERQAALTHNDSARYIDRWVDLQLSGTSPWVTEINKISLPIAHGEGRFYAELEIIARIKQEKLIAATYIEGELCAYQHLSANPNGSLENIAAITDPTGRILGMMPHPERALEFTHLPHWTFLKEKYRREKREIPQEGPGLRLFRNAVNYFVR